MEAFEQFVALALETEGLIVSGALKFDVRRRTAKANHEEWQTHGYEVDLIAARSDKLILATVKSFFGSRGVAADHVIGTHPKYASWYALLNRQDVRDAVVQQAAARFGYDLSQTELRLYVGKFAGGTNEARIREWAASQMVGAGSIGVIDANAVVKKVREVARRKQYRDSPVLATVKVLEATAALR